jgi:hypothetical protein
MSQKTPTWQVLSNAFLFLLGTMFVAMVVLITHWHSRCLRQGGGDNTSETIYDLCYSSAHLFASYLADLFCYLTFVMIATVVFVWCKQYHSCLLVKHREDECDDKEFEVTAELVGPFLVGSVEQV